MATLEKPAPNWYGFSVTDRDYDSDSRTALQACVCFMSNADMIKMAEHYLSEIKLIDAQVDSQRLECANYRRQFVKIYNLCREHLIIRQGQRRYRGELLELLDFISGVRSDCA